MTMIEIFRALCSLSGIAIVMLLSARLKRYLKRVKV